MDRLTRRFPRAHLRGGRGEDGKTAHERIKGRKFTRAIAEIGETIEYKINQGGEQRSGKSEPKYQRGTFLGMRGIEYVIGTSTGTTVSSKIKPVPDDERFDADTALAITAMPWDDSEPDVQRRGMETDDTTIPKKSD